MIVRPVIIKNAEGFDKTKTEVPRLARVESADALRGLLADAAVWMKHNERKKGWVKTSCPRDIAKMYLDSKWAWKKLPTLGAIVFKPLVHLDASTGRPTILDTPGYDPATQLLFTPQGAHFKPIPRSVTRDEAVAAVDRVVARLLADFPFVNAVDKSVALAAMLTSILRPLLPTAPMFAFSAPTAGTGKSFLVDLCVVLATGR
jgi:putative DNA primase/helicase